MGEIRIIRRDPEKGPEWVTIENELEPLQKTVGGYIECVTLEEKDGVWAVLLCDEEGKLTGKQFNCFYGTDSGWPRDILVGTFLVVGAKGDDFTDLPEDLWEMIKDRFSPWKEKVVL